MKPILLLASCFGLALLGCGSGGNNLSSDVNNEVDDPSDNAGTSQTSSLTMPTGFVKVEPIYISSNQISGYSYKNSSGEVKLTNIQKTQTPGVYSLDAEVDGQYYDGAVVHQVGYADMGSVSAVGWDAENDKFAVASFNDESRYKNEFENIDVNGSYLEFYNVSFHYSYIGGNEITYFNDDSGEIIYDSGRIYGDFGFGELTFKGDVKGIDIVNGSSELNVDGEIYPGKVDGIVFYHSGSGSNASFGAFVSSDPTDEILYSGGWAVQN